MAIDADGHNWNTRIQALSPHLGVTLMHFVMI
jgi:hypothetical protein